MRILLTVFVTVSLWGVEAVSTAQAQGVPEVITYQGSLVDAEGAPVNAPVDLAFRFYDGSGGGAVPLPADNAWSERYEGVEVTNGRFSVQLGSQTPLPRALFENRSQLWLQVTVDEEALPRVRITSTAFALEAQSVVDGAAVRSLNGATDEVVLNEGDNVTITQDGNELTISASGPDGGLSSVAVAPPLTGDGTDAAPVSVSEGGISTTELADNAVTTDKIQNETITNAKLVANAAVLSLNGLRSDITIQGEGAATVNSSGNTITISATAPEGGLTSVATDETLTGNGTSDAPLSLADGAAVISLNGGTGALTLEGANGVTVDRDESTITIAAPEDDDDSGVQAIQNADGTLSIQDPNGPTATIDIENNGIPTAKLANSAVTELKIQDGAVTDAKINTTNSPSSGDFLKYIDGELTWDSSLFSDAEEQPSSIRWKENVRTLQDPVGLVERLRGVRYDWKEDGTADVGVIAEEVAEVLPEVVAFEADGRARGVNYGKLVSVLIEATKTQQQTIEQQRQQIKSLEDRMARLEQLVRQRPTMRTSDASSETSDGATSSNDPR